MKTRSSLSNFVQTETNLNISKQEQCAVKNKWKRWRVLW